MIYARYPPSRAARVARDAEVTRGRVAATVDGRFMLLRPIFAGLLAVAQVPEPSPPAGDAAIQWRAPAPCPDRGALLRGIETRLGRPLRAGELGIDAVVTVHATAP